MTYDSPATEHQIGTCLIQGLIHNKIFLLDTKIDMHCINIGVKQLCNIDSSKIQSMH